MNTMKNAIIKTLLCCLLIGATSITLSAQQLPHYSQFDQNRYVLNPGVAGSMDHFEVRAINRSQWTGVTDAPRTFALSLQGPLKNKKVGLGGYLFTDNVGPTRRTGIQFSYSYHLQLNDKIKLGLAASMGALQFTIDGSKIQLAEEGDPALFSELNSQTVFDAKFGAYMYHENWYVGVTLPQLLQNQIQLYESTTGDLSKLEDHYFLMGGYTRTINDDWKVSTNALIKYVAPVPPQFDINFKGHYKDMVFAGLGYRHNDALIFMAGYEYREAISIGFAYDMTTTDIRNYSNGTYEVMVGFRFNQ
jgi:type IX secretion system PorP/SprF family membrane protein